MAFLSWVTTLLYASAAPSRSPPIIPPLCHCPHLDATRARPADAPALERIGSSLNKRWQRWLLDPPVWEWTLYYAWTELGPPELAI